MKKTLSFVMAAGLILSLGACGQGASTKTKAPTAAVPEPTTAAQTTGTPEETKRISDKDVEVSFWHHMEGTNASALETAVNHFNETTGKEYGIVVTPSFQGSNTAEKLNTLAQAGDWKNFPDVCQVASAGIPAISGYDLFVAPEDMYAKGEDILLPRESIIANNARTFTYKDKLCAIPFSNSTILLYYNKELFKAAGLDPENPPKTIAEMADAITKLTAKDGNEVTTYGLNVQVKRYQLVNWVGGEGDFNFIGDNEGGRAGLMSKVTFGEDGSLMTYLNEWEKVIATGGYKPVEDNINEEFAMQLSAMAIMSSARIAKLNDLIGDSFEWGTAPFPKVNAEDKGGTAVGGSGIVMFDKGNADELRASWIFQQYLGGEDAQYDFCTASGYIPMNKDLYEEERMKTYLSENTAMVAAVDQLMASNPNVQEPFDIVTGDINSIIDEEMLAFAQGTSDKQTTHDNIVNKCNEKLEAYVKVNAK
ncbi:extracellular solute-binding protein [Lacrimispora celerecrescens]|uniref:ABC transporter substrate-binding protein n=1 Tax=Lacrimispora celerecrescens TaxID=29354 RepID=A0A084JMV3_9FIRM|nr:extracellular solute-binding protein [Lacrimispora celerecrescens]KEZ90287.1 hypothetical protein IO98_10050 [Lacrimispora celerecrescens]